MNAENVPAAAETCGPGEINVFENMNKVPRRIPTDSRKGIYICTKWLYYTKQK